MKLTLGVSRLLAVCTVIGDFFMVAPAMTKTTLDAILSENLPHHLRVHLRFECLPFFGVQEGFGKGIVLYLQGSNL